ncbi:phosphopantetheine-binding protein [Symbioplanes lichenis]|uniref:phosphopantetheine-binding protein n=1 Tax=Symbioplanes lichenis TaxID=1629072 RepID=UPI00273A4A99|nr:phosphopantetheine-binding protein [Actinoplanes lichenis]
MGPLVTGAELADLLAEAVPDGPRIADPETPFTLDSLRLTWFCHVVHQRYGVSLDDDDAMRFEGGTTISELVDLINDMARGHEASP